MYNVQFVTFSQRRIARRGKFRSFSLFVLEQGRQKSMHEQVSFFVCRSVLTFIRLLYGCFFKYLRVFVACSFSKSFSKACFFYIYVYFWHVQVSSHVRSSLLWVSFIHITSVSFYTCVGLFQSLTYTSFNVHFSHIHTSRSCVSFYEYVGLCSHTSLFT